MRNRILAALVLASLSCWNIPPAMALTNPSSPPKNSPSPAVGDHSCCPGSHAQLALPVGMTMPAPMNMPCGENHPCCMKQGPESSPALPALTGNLRPDWKAFPMKADDRNARARRAAYTEICERLPFDPYSLRSTILRI